jgi:hypothetical protein
VQLEPEVDGGVGWQDAYRMDGEAALADVQNNSAVIGANIQVG